MKKKSNVMLPDVELEQAEDHLTIRLTRFDMKLNSGEPHLVLLIGLIAVWLLLMFLQRMENLPSAFEIKTFTAICGVIGLVVLVALLMRSVKMTAIRVTQDSIDVNIDNENRTTVRDVRKIYVEFKGVHKTLPQFRIVAVNEEGNQWILVSNLTQERAEYIARVIQNYLRLDDDSVTIY